LVVRSERLELRHLTLGDDAFILELVNQPAFLRYIGDRGVRDLESARRYLEEGPLASYAEHGFGLNRVALRGGGPALGICGLLRRPGLSHPDLGFAMLASHRGHGYATEAAAAALTHGRDVLGLRRIVAITMPNNNGSARVLEKVGMRFEGLTTLPGEAVANRLYGIGYGE
jgi:RimJ/RimL family protein N-acetyltransferase